MDRDGLNLLNDPLDLIDMFFYVLVNCEASSLLKFRSEARFIYDHESSLLGHV